jgi:hypothetical protein
MTRLDLLESFTADVAEAAGRLDHEGDNDGFARALASFDDDGSLVVRTSEGPRRRPRHIGAHDRGVRSCRGAIRGYVGIEAVGRPLASPRCVRPWHA